MRYVKNDTIYSIHEIRNLYPINYNKESKCH